MPDPDHSLPGSCQQCSRSPGSAASTEVLQSIESMFIKVERCCPRGKRNEAVDSRVIGRAGMSCGDVGVQGKGDA